MNIKHKTATLLASIRAKLHTLNLDYFVIIASALAVSLPLLRDRVFLANDVFFHQQRARSAVEALSDGQIIAQLDPGAFHGLGYVWNVFYGPLPVYFVSFVHAMIPSWALSINIASFIFVAISGIAMYRFVREIVSSKKEASNAPRIAGLAAAIILIFGVAITRNLYDFVGYGPLMAVFFAIILLHGCYRFINKSNGFAAMIVLGSVGVVLSHSLTALLVAIAAALYMVVNLKRWMQPRKIRQLLILGIISAGLLSFFLVPMVEFMRLGIYNISNDLFTEVYMWKNAANMNSGRMPLYEFFNEHSSWMNMLVLFSVFALAGFAVLYSSITKTVKKDLATFYAISAVFVLLLTAAINWERMPSFLYVMQYPGRMIPVVGILLAIVGGIGVYAAMKDIGQSAARYLVLVLVLLVAIIPIGQPLAQKFSQIDSPGYKDSSFNYDAIDLFGARQVQDYTIAVAEYYPTALAECRSSLEELVTQSRDAYYVAENVRICMDQRGYDPLVINGQAEISNYTRNGSKHSFKISSERGATVELPAVYYPGYVAKINSDGKDKSLQVSYSRNGLVSVVIPENSSNVVDVHYGPSQGTVIGMVVTGTTIAAISSIYFLRKKKNKKETSKK